MQLHMSQIMSLHEGSAAFLAVHYHALAELGQIQAMISTCILLAGASYSFRNKELAVVGGGDTAVEEALYLTKYASKVRRGTLHLRSVHTSCPAHKPSVQSSLS